MFRLRASEAKPLNRSRIATGSQKYRDPKFALNAFTEHARRPIGFVTPEDRNPD